MNAAETLRRAAEIAEELEHCKNALVLNDENGKVVACCIMGAVSLARDEAAERGEATPYAVFEYIERAVGGGTIAWNDSPKTTKEDVVKALKKAAKLAEECGL